MSRLAPIAERAQPPFLLPRPGAHLGLSWRGLTPADATDLNRLVQATEAADGKAFRTSIAETAESFDGEWKDHARDTLVGLDDTGVMRAFAQVRTMPGDERSVRAFLSGGVDPLWRGRGIGSALVEWMQGRGRQALAESGKDLPARLAVYLESDEHAAHQLFTRAGFAPVRYYSEMRRSLAAPLPQVALADGLRIVAWSEDLDDAMRLAHNETFADHWGSEPQTAQAWAGSRAMFAATWSFVVLDEASGKVAGYLASDRYEHDWELAGYSSGYIHLLGVRRPWRGRGIAKALLLRAMEAYRADGIEYAEIGVDTENPSGAHGLYARLGFEAFRHEVLLSIEM